MAAKKIYAVKKGKQTGVFDTWEECREIVGGYPGAEYKGFATIEEAQAYLAGAEPAVKSGPTAGGRKRRNESPGTQRPDIRPVSADELIAYVDGSYDNTLKKYAFGCVFLLFDGKIYTECGNGDTPECLLLRNVTGEMLGAMFAVRFAMANGFNSVELRYDYQGIEKWVTGEWRSKTDLTRKYAEAMRRWNKAIRITFRKVAAHTNVYYNEMADRMAKKGITEADGVPPVRKIQEMQPEEL